MSFKYLGITFHRNGNLKSSQQVLLKQTLRAKAVLDNYLRKHKHLPVKIIFDLFDTLVKPIILYGCEIWGYNMCKDVEQFHLSFLKRILGVKSSTNTCLIYVETGRYPLYVTVYKQIIKYWLRLLRMPEHRFISIIYKKSTTPWSMFVKDLLFQFGFGDVWETEAAYIDDSLFIKQFEQRVMDVFLQSCFSKITTAHRCLLYNALDRNFTMAKYLHIVHIQSNRKAMTKLRLSSHRLLIERGRWLSILPADRICTDCNMIEDEYHAVCICTRYVDIRKHYIKRYYRVKPSMFKFVQLLNTDNIKEMQKLAVFIKILFIKYNLYIFDQSHDI